MNPDQTRIKPKPGTNTTTVSDFLEDGSLGASTGSESESKVEFRDEIRSESRVRCDRLDAARPAAARCANELCGAGAKAAAFPAGSSGAVETAGGSRGNSGLPR